MRVLDIVAATRRRRTVALVTALTLAGACALVVTMGFGRAETDPSTAAPVSKEDMVTFRVAAGSCPALTPAKLAGQVMAGENHTDEGHIHQDPVRHR